MPERIVNYLGGKGNSYQKESHSRITAATSPALPRRLAHERKTRCRFSDPLVNRGDELEKSATARFRTTAAVDDLMADNAVFSMGVRISINPKIQNTNVGREADAGRNVQPSDEKVLRLRATQQA
jgi:hypothetical protein